MTGLYTPLPHQRTVQIGRGLQLLIDAIDYDLVTSGPLWQAHDVGLIYASRKITIRPKTRVRQYAHRLVTDAPDELFIDHKNGDGLDCTRENLRVVGYSKNAQNTHRGRSNPWGFRGVEKICNRYRARICKDGKKYSRNGFSTPEEAARAYDEMALEFYGPFAFTNFERGVDKQVDKEPVEFDIPV
jgi:hypothetical protein